MGQYSLYWEPIIEPGACERIQEMIKDIPEINKNRPCANCVHYYYNRIIRCSLAAGHCDFHHSGFKPVHKKQQTKRNEKWEETGCDQT